MKNYSRGTASQKGLSLIELMVAIALGLLLINGALEMLLSSQATFRNTDDISRIQENGRFATDFLVRNVRMAGYKDREDGVIDGLFYAENCPNFNGPCTNNGTDGHANIYDRYDRIAVHVDPPPDDGTETDCIGTILNARDTIANIFFIDDIDGDGVNSLYCHSLNTETGNYLAGNPQPLVDGIDDMQILYGVKDSTERVSQYRAADAVTDWDRVGTVRLAILVNSGDIEGQDTSRSRNFTLLDGDQQTFNDRHNRQVFSTTIYINNSKSDSL